MAEQGVLGAEAEVEKGEMARMASFVGAIAIADLVKSTLGPKGMDKILQSMSGITGDIQVTNDGATILQSIIVENPASKVLVDIARTQDDEVGDGTTSVTVLTGELLREAEKLINMKIHPMIIAEGWREATQVAREALEKASVDDSASESKLHEHLMDIARTTLSSKLLYHEKEHFAKLAVDAVLRIRDSLNLEQIQVLKKAGGSLKDSFLDEGFILNKKLGVGAPRRLENARVLVANTQMDTDKVKIFGSRVKVDSMSKVAEIEAAEKAKMKAKCQKIIDHGINVFINRQLIYDYPEELLTQAGVMTIEHADFEGVERLSAVLGADIVSTFDHPELVQLGECKVVEEIMIGEDKLIKFSGPKSKSACTIVLRGASTHVLGEAERSLHDALAVLTQAVKEPRIVYGGGCSETLMANAVEDLAKRTPGKKALAMESFAKALRQLPTIISDNAGLDSSELVAQLKAAHYAGNNTAGIDIRTGSIGNMAELGIVEALKLKMHVLLSAAEAAEMILRVDEVIKCAPRQRSDPHPHM